MALSKDAKKAYKKAVKAKNKRQRKHWLFFRKGDGVKEIFSKLITQVALVVLIGCGVVLGNEARLSLSAQFLSKSLTDLYHTFIHIEDKGDDNADPMPGAKRLLQDNPETIGWVRIADTKVDGPVVQRKSADGNEYYLKRSFDGKNNKAGTIFLDMRATLTYSKRSDQLVIYGHNQKDRTMFGDLYNYKNNVDYYKKHPVIDFSSNYRSDKYKIFAYFVAPVTPNQTRDGVIFDYHNYINFSGKAQYTDFVNHVALRSQIITDVDLEYGDEFLTLSTCSNEYDNLRFVVFSRKVRKGEDASVDVGTARMNPNVKEPDWDVIRRQYG
ncbi:MAG: class B sortase [Oscillospiraceae bacterium]|nr:class B sortase [Oscillospiraceae bacterium]